jgi:hypothetical protein
MTSNEIKTLRRGFFPLTTREYKFFFIATQVITVKTVITFGYQCCMLSKTTDNLLNGRSQALLANQKQLLIMMSD